MFCIFSVNVHGAVRSSFTGAKKREMRLIVIQAGAMVADVVCGEQAVYVGSREDCRIHLNDPRIAARQLVIYPESDGWAVAQLAPQCKVLINTTHLEDKVTLNDSDEIKVCDYGIRVHPDYLPPSTARVAVGTSRAQLERFAASRLPPGTFVKKTDESLSIPVEQISQIGQANLGVSQCTMVEELMDVALQNLLETFAAQRAWMGVRRANYGPMEYQEGAAPDRPANRPAGSRRRPATTRARPLSVPVGAGGQFERSDLDYVRSAPGTGRGPGDDLHRHRWARPTL